MFLRGTLIIVSAFYMLQVSAMGLGDIRIQSTLNEPLKAEIPLWDADGVALGNIHVQMASPETYKKLGVERLEVVSQIETFLQSNSKNKPVVLVQTKEPLYDPYLIFLVEVNWPNGHVLKKFTILMDPPAFQEGENDPVSKVSSEDNASIPSSFSEHDSQTEGVAQNLRVGTKDREPSNPIKVLEKINLPEMAQNIRNSITSSALPTNSSVKKGSILPSQPSSDQLPPTQVVNVTDPSLLSGRTYGPTKASDELWSIARHYAPQGWSYHQFMVATLVTNPEAFSEQNINELKTGVVLKLPSEKAMNFLTTSEALREVIRQNKVWEEGDGADDNAPNPLIVLNPTIESAPTKTPSTSPSLKEGSTRVSNEIKSSLDPIKPLILPSGNPSQVESAGAVMPAGEKNLKAVLAVSADAIQSIKQENQTMAARVSELEKRNQALEKMVTTKDAELLRLEQNLKEYQENQVGEANPDIDKGQGISKESTVVTQSLENNKDAEAPVVIQKKVQTAIQTTGQDVSSKTHALGWLMTLIFFFLWSVVIYRFKEIIKGWMERLKSLIGVLFRGKKEKSQEDVPPLMPQEKPTVYSPTPPIVQKTLHSKIKEFGTEPDVLEEVTVYLAYDRFEQAIEVLHRALERSPLRLDLWGKLFEIYVQQNDESSFTHWQQKIPSSLIQSHPDFLSKVQTWEKSFKRKATDESSTPLISENDAMIPASSISTPEVIPSPLETSPKAEASDDLEFVHYDIPKETTSSALNVKTSSPEDEEALEFESTQKPFEEQPKEEPSVEKAAEILKVSSTGMELTEKASQPAPTKEKGASPSNAFQFETVDTFEEPTFTPILEESNDPDFDPVQFDGDLDVAIAYIEIEDFEGAEKLLLNILQKGTLEQMKLAQNLLQEIALKKK